MCSRVSKRVLMFYLATSEKQLNKKTQLSPTFHLTLSNTALLQSFGSEYREKTLNDQFCICFLHPQKSQIHTDYQPQRVPIVLLKQNATNKCHKLQQTRRIKEATVKLCNLKALQNLKTYFKINNTCHIWLPHSLAIHNNLSFCKCHNWDRS